MEENVFYKPGEPSSVMSLNEEVDLFASCVNIYTTETDVYGDIMDEPRELEVFDEGAWAFNLATGIVATLGLAACAVAVVATGGAALAVVAFASAAVGTGLMTAGMSYADKKNQKNRSNLEYGIGLMLGAAVGALTGVGIMYAGPALAVAGEQAGFEASFLMGTNALTVSTIPDIVTAGGMTLLATDGAYVLNEINTMCTGQNLAVDTVFEGNEENYEACVVALQVLNDGLLDLTTRGYQRNGSGSSSSEAEKSDEGAEIAESGVNIRGAGDESGTNSVYIPKDADGKPIPLNKQRINGQDIPLPDPATQGRPHTVLGGKISSETGEVYRQSATFNGGSWPTANGYEVPLSEVHWTNHGRADEHTNPHQHVFIYDFDNRYWYRSDPEVFK